MRQIALLEVSPNGIHFHATESTDPQTTWSGQISDPLEIAAMDLVDGGYIVDARHMAKSVHRYAVIHGPLCDPRLTASEASPAPTAEEFARMSLMVSGGFRDLCALGTRNPRAFDYLSPAGLAEFWAKLGARIGQHVGDRIEWSTGHSDEIATCAADAAPWKRHAEPLVLTPSPDCE